jgi:hypothetical protein
MHNCLRMQTRCTRSEKLKQPFAKPRAAPRRRDHQDPRQTKPRDFVGHAHDGAGREDDALQGKIVGECARHGCGLCRERAVGLARDPSLGQAVYMTTPA